MSVVVKERFRYSFRGQLSVRGWVAEAEVWRSVQPAQHPGLVCSGPADTVLQGSVMTSQIHQDTSFDYVPIQIAPPSWRMSYYWLLCGMSPGQYRLRVSVRCDEVCDVQEQRTLIGGQ